MRVLEGKSNSVINYNQPKPKTYYYDYLSDGIPDINQHLSRNDCRL